MFKPRPLHPSIHWTGGSAGSRESLDNLKTKNLLVLSVVELQFPGSPVRGIITLTTMLLRW
jgi:hypothetical protein